MLARFCVALHQVLLHKAQTSNRTAATSNSMEVAAELFANLVGIVMAGSELELGNEICVKTGTHH